MAKKQAARLGPGDSEIHGLEPDEWFKIGVLIRQNVWSRLTDRELELLHEAEASEDLALPPEFWTSLLKNHS
jgi:hypothetical protein